MASFNVSSLEREMGVKILFVSNMSWNLFNFRLGLMKALKLKGYEILFCAPRDKYTQELEQLGFSHLPIQIDRGGMNIFKDFGLFVSFLRIYIQIKPDMILHFTIKPNIYGTLSAKIAGIRCMNTVSGLGFMFNSKRIFQNIAKFLYKLACTFSKKTFFHNQQDLDFFINNGLIKKEKALLVNGSGVNAQYFSPDVTYKSVLNEKFSFLFLGRILWDKGIAELVEAARLVKERYPFVQIFLLGGTDTDNPSSVPIEKVNQWQKEGLIKYLGEVLDVRPYIASCDCVILPSYSEGAPRSLLEAASMQKPIIASNIAGCSQIVEDSVNGFLFNLNEESDLSRKMLDMIELPEVKRINMGLNGRKKVLQQFSEEKTIASYIKAL